MPTPEYSSTVKIYQSSAGSGKTFTLVREYLGIVLREPYAYRHALAITFTNKAAGEMKERIISELNGLVKDGHSSMGQAIEAEFGLSPELIQSNAQKVRALILHDYANFAVRTIDSFTHQLIRHFARDLGLPSQFEVEMDNAGLITQMVDRLMDAIGRDPYVTDILVRFTREKLEEEKGWNIEREIQEVGGEIFKETSQLPVRALNMVDEEEMPAFISFVKERITAFVDELQALAAEAVELATGMGFTVGDFSHRASGAFGQLKKLLVARTPKEMTAVFESARFAKALENESAWFSGKLTPPQEALLSAGFGDRVRLLHSFFEENFEEFNTAFQAYQHIHSLAVLRQIEALLEEFKEQNSLVHISDFQERIKQIVLTEAPEYIYWRLGEKFHHFLVDEFQDTSLVQYLNLKPLFEHVRSVADRNSSLLFVGDSKQAIYRFRGGEVDLLDKIVPHEMEAEPLALRKNYRSLEHVVNFNNLFFRTAREVLKANPFVRDIYTNFEQEVREDHLGGGFVRVELLTKESREADSFKLEATDRCVSIAQSSHQQGFAWRDMAVLVRTRDEGSMVALALTEAKIPVISQESIMLASCPEIIFLVAILKFLGDPTDQVARAEVLHFFFHYLHPEVELDVDPNTKIREILGQDSPVRAMMDEMPAEFRSLRSKLDQLPLYELVEGLIRIFDMGTRAPAFLQHFLDLVLDFCGRRKPDLPTFLDYWADKKGMFSVQVPPGEDAVEVITIHKSKGLEYPVVILPYCNWSLKPKTYGTFWAEASGGFGEYPHQFLLYPRKELEQSLFSDAFQLELQQTLLDNLNSLYVAFTRPRERLYIISEEIRIKNNPATLADYQTVSHLITAVMEQGEFGWTDGGLFEMGLPMAPTEPSAPVSSQQLDRIQTETWRKRIRVERRYRQFWETEDAEARDISEAAVMREALKGLRERELLPMVMADLQELGLVDAARRAVLESRMEAFLARAPLSEWLSGNHPMRKPVRLFHGQKTLEADLLVSLPEGHVLLFFGADAQGRKSTETGWKAALAALELSPVSAYRVALPEGQVIPLQIK